MVSSSSVRLRSRRSRELRFGWPCVERLRALGDSVFRRLRSVVLQLLRCAAPSLRQSASTCVCSELRFERLRDASPLQPPPRLATSRFRSSRSMRNRVASVTRAAATVVLLRETSSGFVCDRARGKDVARPGESRLQSARRIGSFRHLLRLRLGPRPWLRPAAGCEPDVAILRNRLARQHDRRVSRGRAGAVVVRRGSACDTRGADASSGVAHRARSLSASVRASGRCSGHSSGSVSATATATTATASTPAAASPSPRTVARRAAGTLHFACGRRMSRRGELLDFRTPSDDSSWCFGIDGGLPFTGGCFRLRLRRKS